MYLKCARKPTDGLSQCLNFKNTISAVVAKLFWKKEQTLEEMEIFIPDDTYSQKNMMKLQQNLYVDIFWCYKNRQLTYNNLLYVSNNHFVNPKLLYANYNFSLP